VDSNHPQTVETQSKKAFQLCQEGNWLDAMTALTELKAVGPATASAILAPLFPLDCPFMADEVLEAVNGQRDYTIRAYTSMRKYLVEKAVELSREANKKVNGHEWTAEEVGRAMWSSAVLSRTVVTTSISSSAQIINPIPVDNNSDSKNLTTNNNDTTKQSLEQNANGSGDTENFVRKRRKT